MNMTDNLFKTVKEYGMLQKGDEVTVALSGGADSMCLLDILIKNSQVFGITVKAAHLNHMLRGEESDRDEAFVTGYCKKNNIFLTVKRADINALRQKGEGIEEAARRIRYDFLKETAGNGKIATAHTLSDSAETVLLNITRGTSISGICGILPVRDNIIRPIIGFTRQMTEEYCKLNGIEYVTDSTNLEDVCRRNVIRHNIIPVLTKMNPAFFDGIKRMTDTAVKEDEYMSDLADELLKKAKVQGGYNCDVLSSGHSVILRRAIKKLLKDRGISPQSALIEGVEDVILSGKNFEVTKGISFRKRRGVLEEFSPKTAEFFSASLNDRIENNSKIIECQKISVENYKNMLNVNKMLAKQSVDFDKIQSDAVIRNRKASDKIKLSKRPSKSLKKLYNEYGIIPEERDELLVLADSTGVCWLEGFGADESAAVSDTTETVLILTIKTKHPKE